MSLIRALTKAVKLPEHVPLTAGRYGPGTGFASLLGNNYDAARQAYLRVGAVHGPVRRICESVSLVDWNLLQQKPNGDREQIDDATAPAQHEGTAIWTHPNEFMTRRTLLYRTQLELELTGRTYWLLTQPHDASGTQSGINAGFELWPIRRELMYPMTDPDRYIVGYTYRIGTTQIPLPLEAVIPLSTADPMDEFGGSGAIQAVMTDIESDTYAAQRNRNYFYNDASPGGVIQFEKPMSKDRWDEFVLRWREQHQGVSNAHRAAIIEGGTWVNTETSVKDMDFVNLRKLSRDQVMFALGMPFSMFVTEGVNYSQAQSGERVYFRWNLRPRLENIKEPLNEYVMPLCGENLTMEYNLPAPEDEAFDLFAASSGWLAGWLRKNDARQAAGYDADPDDPDGDKFLYELIGTLPPMPTKPPKAPTTLGYDDAIAKRWPAAMQGPEQNMADVWGNALDGIRQQFIDYVEKRG